MERRECRCPGGGGNSYSKLTGTRPSFRGQNIYIPKFTKKIELPFHIPKATKICPLIYQTGQNIPLAIVKLVNNLFQDYTNNLSITYIIIVTLIYIENSQKTKAYTKNAGKDTLLLLVCCYY